MEFIALDDQLYDLMHVRSKLPRTAENKRAQGAYIRHARKRHWPWAKIAAAIQCSETTARKWSQLR